MDLFDSIPPGKVQHCCSNFGLGWINNNLTKVTIREANTIQVSYLRASGSRSKGSDKVFNCLHQLIDAVKQRHSKDAGTASEV